jgi:ABC-type amino acid transport system permease subunit
VIALTLLYGAFIAEIYRAALSSIPAGQREAGLAVGMRPSRVFARIVLPQATKIAIPNLGSMFIGMIKDTSTFTLIGMLEIVHVTQDLESNLFQPFVLYSAAAGLYVIAAFVVDFVFRRIEKALTTPPSGGLSSLLRRRRRARLQAVVARVEALSAQT